MYYDNKSTFYIKQYGPAVFTIVISLVLVLGGLYIYLSSNRNNKPQETLVAKNVTEEQQITLNENTETTNSLQEVETKKESENEIVDKKENVVEEVKPVVAEIEPKEEVTETIEKVNVNDIKTSNTLSSDLARLSKLSKSKDAKVLGVDDNKNIIIELSGISYKTRLIGIDYKKSKSDIKEKIDNDLTNKNVTIAFDNVKQENDIFCVYMYVDGNLYNKELLKNGLAILNVEKANTSLLNELVNAQKEAKTNNIGIWQK